MVESKNISEFTLTYEQAKDHFKAFPEYQFKTVSAILIVIGWMLTANTAQTFIAEHSDFTLPGTMLAFGLLMFFKCIWIIGHYKRMCFFHKRLARLAGFEGLSNEVIEPLKLSIVLPITYLIINLLLCSAAILVVWMICQ